MFKKLLIHLLNVQEKRWINKLTSVNFEYDCVNLSDSQLEYVVNIKSTIPAYIQTIKDLKRMISE